MGKAEVNPGGMCSGGTMVECIGDPFYFAMLEGDVTETVFLWATAGRENIGMFLKDAMRPCFRGGGCNTFYIGMCRQPMCVKSLAIDPKRR